MKRVLLLQLDGKLPNVALMRVAAHHRALGNEVRITRAPNRGSLKKARWADTDLKEAKPDLVYASLIFERTRERSRPGRPSLTEHVLETYPNAILGGTGWDLTTRLEDHGITTKEQDCSIYPEFEHSIGFTQRGCRLRCPFCVVPKTEGAQRDEHSVASLWRGDRAKYQPRNLHKARP